MRPGSQGKTATTGAVPKTGTAGYNNRAPTTAPPAKTTSIFPSYAFFSQFSF